MAKITPFAVVLLLAVGPGQLVATIASATTPAAKRVTCRPGAKRAVIGGRIRCLQIGMQCDTHFNTTKPSYRSYGFLCSSWYTGAPTTLMQIAQPRPAPATCNGIEPTPSSAHPGSQSAWVGSSPLWVGPYLDWRTDAANGVWHYRYSTGVQDRNGWGVKFLWQLLSSVGPARISFTDLATGRPLTVIISGLYIERGTEHVLDPSKPGHGDPFGQHPDAAEWGSTVFFPSAGCYQLSAQWATGSANVVFSFGR